MVEEEEWAQVTGCPPSHPLSLSLWLEVCWWCPPHTPQPTDCGTAATGAASPVPVCTTVGGWERWWRWWGGEVVEMVGWGGGGG